MKTVIVAFMLLFNIWNTSWIFGAVSPEYIFQRPIRLEYMKNINERKGKIGQTMLGLIHIKLLITLRYLLYEILQTKLQVILDI